MFRKRKSLRNVNRRPVLAWERLESRLALTAGFDNDLLNLPEGESPAMPDFHAVDLNPVSPRFNQSISPRDYLNQVSAWYFTHST